jgi:putative DNA primase/helicase
MVDKTERALIASGIAIFRRGTSLVHPIAPEVTAADNRRTVTVAFAPLNLFALNERISRAAVFQKLGARKKWRRCDTPLIVSQTLLSRKGQNFPSVTAITSTPLLRPDGSVIDRSGYDRATRMYLALDNGLCLAPRAKPSRQDAVEALNFLKGLLYEFPFVSDTDQSVALSMLMTALLRPSINVAPFHLIRAHDSGTGKSYLVDIAAAIATGRWAPAIDMSRGGEEVGKRLEAVLIAGTPIISLDNLEGEIGGAAMCLFAERPLISLRLLGRSQMLEIESRAAAFGTGNNVVPTKDIVRRMLVADLDAAEERPEQRKFKGNPLSTHPGWQARGVRAARQLPGVY